MLKSSLILSLACLFSTALTAQEVDWETNLAAANKKAAKENKLVLIHFTADWCRPCKSLETFVFSSPHVTTIMKENVVPVKIDVDLQPDLVTEFGISGVPADVVVTPTGRVVTKRNSPTTVGEYVRMVSGLQKKLNGIEEGNVSLAQNIDELNNMGTHQADTIAEYNDFQPESPTHTVPKHEAPRHSNDGKNLERRSRAVAASKPLNSLSIQKNPFFEPKKQSQPMARIEGIRDPEVQEPNDDFAVPAEVQTPLRVANAEPASDKQVENEHFARIQRAEQVRIEQQRVLNAKQAEAKKKLAAKKSKENRSMFALHGKCPVTLLTESKWVDGSEDWGCVHRGRTYLFTSKLHLVEFQRDPDKYSPLLAGYDPVIYHERGELVQGLEENGVFMGTVPNQRVVLFSSTETRARFQESAEEYIETVRQAMMSSSTPGQTKMR